MACASGISRINQLTNEPENNTGLCDRDGHVDVLENSVASRPVPIHGRAIRKAGPHGPGRSEVIATAMAEKRERLDLGCRRVAWEVHMRHRACQPQLPGLCVR